MAQCFARVLGLQFGRVQFTPDLMPGDIVGANIFNFQTSQFTLTRGPVFCELLLADEINRTPPKTQAALLEAMQERHVTIDGVRHDLGPRFTVIATQNPIEQQGTYPLPEAQLDRFLFKQVLDYPSEAEEQAIVAGHGTHTGMSDPASFGVQQVADAATIGAAVAAVARVRHRRPGGGLHRGPGARDPHQHGPGGRRLAARRRHAGGGQPRPRRAGRARLRHPRRREGAGAAGAQPPGDPVARRGDRRAQGGRRGGRADRAGGGARCGEALSPR